MILITSLCVITSQIIIAKFVDSAEAVKINMTVRLIGDTKSECTGHSDSYTFEEGTVVETIINGGDYINFAWRNITHFNDTKEENLDKYLHDNHTTIEMKESITRELHEGFWNMTILNHKNMRAQMIKIRTYNESSYVSTDCAFNVTVINRRSFWERLSEAEKFMYISGGAGLMVVLIIIVQTATILHYKKKAQAARVHQNLSVKRESNDRARYSAGVTRKTQNRDSGLYETLDEVNSKRTVPPVPPAIETLPKNAGRAIQHSMGKMVPKASSLSSTHLLAETGYSDETLRLQNRAPVPLPEEYEEVGDGDTYEAPPEHIEEDTYESPPEIELPKCRVPGREQCRPFPKKPMPLPPEAVCRTKRLNTVNPSDLSPNTQRKNKWLPDPTSTMPKSAAKNLQEKKNPMAAELNNILQRRHAGQSILNPPNPSAQSNNAPPVKPALKKQPIKPPVATKNINNIIKPNKLAMPKPSQPAATEPSKHVPTKLKVPTIFEAQASPLPRKVLPPPNQKGLVPANVTQLVPPPHPIRVVSTDNNEPNSSDEEWTYEELPRINLNKSEPSHDQELEVLDKWQWHRLDVVSMFVRKNQSQLLDSNEDAIYNDPNTSDEEWTYEELPEININKLASRWNNK